MGLTKEVIEAERFLPVMAKRFDMPIDAVLGSRIAALAFARRGFALYRGFRHSLSAPTLDTAHVALRAVFDVTILARWMEGDPELRFRLWLAEDERNRLIQADLLPEYYRRRRQAGEMAFTPQRRAEMKAEIDAARTAGLAAGVAIGAKGSLLPSGDKMAHDVDDLWEPYNMAYRWLSPAAHAGSRSFAADQLVKRDGRTYLVHRPAFNAGDLRALAVPVMCMLFASASRQLGLGIEGQLDEVRLRAVFGPGGLPWAR